MRLGKCKYCLHVTTGFTEFLHYDLHQHCYVKYGSVQIIDVANVLGNDISR